MRSQRLIHIGVILLVLLAGIWRVSTQLHRQALNQQLVLAIEQGDLARVKLLVNQGANIHCKVGEGVPILSSAEEAAHPRRPDESDLASHKVAIAGFLLNQVVRDKVYPEERSFVLDLAVDNNRVDVVRRLMNPASEECLSILDRAAKQGKSEIVALFLDRGIRPAGLDAGGYALRAASGSPTGLPTVKMLLQRGVDVNCADQARETALMSAAGSGQLDIARILLEHGAKVNLRNLHGDTALMYAVGYGHLTLVKELIAYGADVNVKGTLLLLIYVDAGNMMRRMQGTPLQIALQNRYFDIARLLKQAGAKQ